MAEKIGKMTKDQEDRIPEWMEEWSRIGLSCEPANFDEAERGVRGCYRAAGLKEPEIVLRVASPFAAVCTGPIATLMLRGDARDQVDDQVYAQVRAQVRDQVRKLNCKAIRDEWLFYRGGNLWAGWYAYATFMRDVLGLSGGALDGFQWDELHARNAGWCWYGDRVAVISDRPERLLFDESGVLHCEDGMAARWRDGWGLWMLGGIRVDEQIVMRPETQTIEQINQEENADVKSIRIERFGWARYLKESRSKLLDHRHNDIENTVEALYDAPDGSRRLVATCPTGRVFVMGCPSDVQTCAQAQNWLGGDELDAKSRCLGRT